MNATIAYLKSERFVFTALLFVLVGQVVNFAHIFSAANPKLTADAPPVAVWLYAGICTVGLEMAILVSVLNGKRAVAALFAAGFLAINLCWNYQVWADPLPVAVAKSLIYVMLSVTIWFFSDLFGQKIAEAEARAAQTGTLEQKAADLQQAHAVAIRDVAALETELAAAREWDALRQDESQRNALAINALRGDGAAAGATLAATQKRVRELESELETTRLRLTRRRNGQEALPAVAPG